MRRPADDGLAFRSGRIPRPHFCADVHIPALGGAQGIADGRQRLLEILMDIVAERLEGGHIKDSGLIRHVVCEALAKQLVEGSQKSGQSLPRTRWR